MIGRRGSAPVCLWLLLSPGMSSELREQVGAGTVTGHVSDQAAVFGSAAVVTITSARDPRVIQLALKFVF